MLKSICKYCCAEFTYNEHNSKGKYCNKQCRISFNDLIKQSKLRPCIQCSLLTLNPKFCSSSCSAIYSNTGSKHSAESKNKISAALLSVNRTKDFRKICPVSWCKICDKYMPNSKRKTCSDACLSVLYTKQGQQLAKTVNKRSKQEIELYNMCYESFNNVLHNEIISDGRDADIILPDQKIAILRNGPWHYKQMPVNNHSLLQVQNRDKLKIKIFAKLGWNILLFEDRYYTPLSAYNKIKLVVDKRIELLHPAYETSVLPLN